jgi:hypothetical protein
MKFLRTILTIVMLSVALSVGASESGDTVMIVPDYSLMDYVDTIRVDTSLLNLPEWNVHKRPKHYFLSAGEVVGANLFFHVVTRYVANEDYAKISWHSISRNFRKGFYWDNDQFKTNLFSHPYQGNLYYNCARTNGLNFWESAPYALLGSSIWEMFMETQPPSTNDIIATTFGGIALGEMCYRVSSLLLNSSSSGFERVVREALATIVNPVGGVHRLCNGDMWHPGSRYVNKEAMAPFHLQFGLGYRLLNDMNRDHSESRHVASADLAFLYNNPFNIDGKTPFETFKVRFLFNMSSKQPHVGVINLCASIWGHNTEFKSGSQIYFGIFQNYNFYNTEALKKSDADVPFRIAETVSYGPGFICRLPARKGNGLVLSAYASGIILGGSLSDHYNVQERDYDMGSGYSFHSEGMMHLGQRIGFYYDFEHYHIFTWKGYEKKDVAHIDPNYLNVQGATGNAWMHVARLRSTIGVLKYFGISAEVAWYWRHSHYKYFDDIHSRTFEFHLMLSYQI